MSYETTDAGIKITIEDTGSGIGQEQLEHLFDAYYRGLNAVDIPGEGIGLYVVKENLSKLINHPYFSVFITWPVR